MRRTFAFALAAIGLASAAAAAPDPIAGYDRFEVAAPHRAAPVAASVWYPVGTPTYRGLIGDNELFEGTPAYVGAAIAEGQFPLVLLSHGSGGNMDNLSWLSSRLALRGAMVLAVNHPGSTSGDSSPRRSVRLAERAADLSAALDHVLADPDFAPHIDKSRIASLGFSLGGATALNLVGARIDRGLYRDYCAKFGDEPADCTFFAKGGVDLANLPDAFEGDARDPRIGAAVAVDPGLTYAFTDTSVAAMNLPVLLINLGGEERLKAADVSAKGSNLVGRLPRVEYATASPANHFTFLALCKPGGRERLAEEHDDPVCDDPAGTDRERIHEEIVDRIAKFLGL
jgi:predicted dienelactone hydrolase